MKIKGYDPEATLHPPFKVIRTKSKEYQGIQSEGPSVKLDAVYKPLLRRFRGYFRAKFDEDHNKRDYLHWSI